ncbi:MAG: ABC transporter permease subunit [Rhodospirillaceae bacterium]|nr:ABC transporter permease subunit [Rhodospirillaceae bacterium]
MPIVVWQALFFVSALLFVVVMTFWSVRNFRLTPGFEAANWVKTFGAGYFRDTYFRTFLYAALAAVAASLAAFPCAYALAFHVPRALRRATVFLLVIPYFTSYLVRIYSWKILLTDEGVINLALGALGLGPFRMYNNLFGTTVGYLTLVFPLVVLLQLLSLANADRSLIEAAHNLRCGRLRTVFLVIVPLARAGLVLAFTFAFILAFGDFVSPTFLGGSKPPTLSILMVDTVRSGSDWPRASVIAVTMVATLLAVAFLAMGLAYRGRARPLRDGGR